MPSAMGSALLEGQGRYVLANTMLGTSALYEVLDEHDDVVTAEVIDAPGLPRGMRVRLLATATRAMKHVQV